MQKRKKSGKAGTRKNRKPSPRETKRSSEASGNRRLPRSTRASSLTRREKDARKRSLALLSDFRRGRGTFEQLLREHHLARQTAYKNLGRDLRRGGRGRRVRPSKADSRVREILFPLPFGDVLRRIRGSRAATQLSEFFTDRGKLLGNKLSAQDFEAKWRGVRIAGQEVFADAATIFLRATFGDLKIDDLYGSVGGAE
jgi:hypothetical protein